MPLGTALVVPPPRAGMSQSRAPRQPPPQAERAIADFSKGRRFPAVPSTQVLPGALGAGRERALQMSCCPARAPFPLSRQLCGHLGSPETILVNPPFPGPCFPQTGTGWFRNVPVVLFVVCPSSPACRCLQMVCFGKSTCLILTFSIVLPKVRTKSPNSHAFPHSQLKHSNSVPTWLVTAQIHCLCCIHRLRDLHITESEGTGDAFLPAEVLQLS